MSAQKSSAGVVVSVIVAGLLVAAAIVFGPQIRDSLRRDDAKPNDPSAPATTKSDAPAKAESDEVTLTLTSGKLDQNWDTSGVSLFIDGIFRRKIRPYQSSVSDTYQLRPGDHELCWIVYRDYDRSVACVTTLITLRAATPTIYQFPSVGANFFMGGPDGLKDGLRLYRRTVESGTADILRSGITVAERIDVCERGLKRFYSNDLWRAVKNTAKPDTSARGRVWVSFPHTMGGRRSIDAEEMQQLKYIFLKEFDGETGFPTFATLYKSDQSYITLRQKRQEFEEFLDELIGDMQRDSVR